MPKPKLTSPAENEEDEAPQLHPIIEGLLGELPPPGTVFPVEARKLWLQVLELVLKLIYPEHAETPPA